MANLQKLIDLDGLSYFLEQIKAKFVRSVNGVKPDSKGNVDVPQISANEIVNIIYPVGSLYWSSKSTDPATLFGGTWKRIKDKFILAAGDTYAAGSTGGAASVALTTKQIPAHAHSASTNSTGGHTHTLYSGAGGSGGSYFSVGQVYGAKNRAVTSPDWNGDHAHTVNISNTGGNQAHDNMPPYIVFYCWERTN